MTMYMSTCASRLGRALLFSFVMFATPQAYSVTCAQGSRSIVATTTNFCPTCWAHPTPTRSAKLLNRSTCLQCSLFCPITALAPADAGIEGLQSTDGVASGACVDVHGGKYVANGPLPVAVLVDWSRQTSLIHQRPEVAAALALMEWNGQRDGLIRDEEFVVSFLGSPTSSTVSFIQEHGAMSGFDSSFSALPRMHSLRVSVTLRSPSGGRNYEMVAVTTRHHGERVVEALAPVVLRGSGAVASVADTSGASEPFFAVELDVAP